MDTLLAWFEGNPAIRQAADIALLLAVAGLAHIITKKVLLKVVGRIVRGTAFKWDDALEARGVFGVGAWLAPSLVLFYGVRILPLHPTAVQVLQRFSGAILILAVTFAATRALNALNDIYEAHSRRRSRPIKGYVQLIQLFVYLMGGVAFVSALFDKSPWTFMSGIGAMTAVLMLIFKDTLLSLVASVQLATNDMVRIGDWIEMPQYNADGFVVDVALHTVKVQNWDKTLTTIPTYALISEGFRNWRTMPESGGRRIKRSVFIDMNTIKHLDEKEILRLRDFGLLTEYLERKMQEVAETNRMRGEKIRVLANQRRLTNVGTFRAYIEAYLRSHPGINHDMLMIVRHMALTPQGLPLEVYCFTRDTRWVQHEGVQADVFDHILAIAPEFGLRVFQSPSGADLQSAKFGMRNAEYESDGEGGGEPTPSEA